MKKIEIVLRNFTELFIIGKNKIKIEVQSFVMMKHFIHRLIVLVMLLFQHL